MAGIPATEFTSLKERVRSAIELMSESDLLKVRSFAEWRIRGLGRKARGRTAEDLMHEAVVASLEGRRVWYAHVDFVNHLCGAVRSISSNWKHQYGEEYLESELSDSLENRPIDFDATTSDPEKRLMLQEEFSGIATALANDPVALSVAQCLGAGYTANEAQLALELSPREYATAVRRLRRRLKSTDTPSGAGAPKQNQFHFRRVMDVLGCKLTEPYMK